METTIKNDVNVDPNKGWVLLKDVPEPDHPPFVIDSVLHEGVTTIYGRPEAGKSFVCLSAVASVMTGEPWLGEYKVRETHNVAFLALDLGQVKQLKRRAAHYPVVADNMTICAKRPDTERDWHDTGRDLSGMGVSFLVIDNLTRLLPAGVSIRDDAQVERVMRNIQVLVQEYGLGILLVHHSGKPGEDGQPRKTPLGVTAIESFSPHFIRVECEDDFNRKITSYGNDVEQGSEEIGFRIVDGVVTSQSTLADAKLQRLINDGPWKNQTEIANAIGIQQQNVSKFLKARKHMRNRVTGMIEPIS